MVNNEKKFIAPQYWAMLNLIIKNSSKFDSLAYLTNRKYKSSLAVPKILDVMMDQIPGFQRNYSWLVNNLETILVYLINVNNATLFPKRERFRVMLNLLRENRDKVISSHIPIPSKELYLVEDTQFSSKKLNLVTGVVKSLALNYRDAIDNGRDTDAAISR